MSLDVQLALREHKSLDELVTVEEEGKFVIVRAKAWLGEDWHKINDVLHLYEVEWMKLGKQGHWRIPLESIIKSTEEKPKAPIPLEQPTPKQPHKTTLQINEEYLKLLPKLPEKEYQALKNSISEEGQHYPIIVNENKEILDGHHRYQVCLEVNREAKYETKLFENKLSEKKFVIESNLLRRQLNDFQKIELGYPLLEIEKELGKQRMIKHGQTQEPLSSNELGGQARNIVAKKIGVSPTTFQRAITIIEKGSEDVKENVRKGKTSITYAYNSTKRKEQHREPPMLPVGVFDVIYADPPWEYYLPLRGSPDMHYPTMKTEDVCELEIPTSENSVLFLWATNPKLEDALKVIRAWGFKYKTNMVWVKNKFGTGYYFRGQHELLLVATKGKIPIPTEETRFPSVLEASVKKHSDKPIEAYGIIEQMYPNRKYLELFARQKREKWESWGSEIEAN